MAITDFPNVASQAKLILPRLPVSEISNPQRFSRILTDFLNSLDRGFNVFIDQEQRLAEAINEAEEDITEINIEIGKGIRVLASLKSVNLTVPATTLFAALDDPSVITGVTMRVVSGVGVTVFPRVSFGVATDTDMCLPSRLWGLGDAITAQSLPYGGGMTRTVAATESVRFVVETAATATSLVVDADLLGYNV